MQVALVYRGSANGQGIMTYMNGKENEQVTQSLPGGGGSGGGELMIGRLFMESNDSNLRYAKAQVDELFIWNRERNAEDIKQNYED